MRKKISKSAGNSPDDPTELIADHGADAVRYWAAGGRLGMDMALDRNQFKIGRRLAIKILNASRFVLGLGEPPDGATPTAALDLAILDGWRRAVEGATTAFEGYDFARALERVESRFWTFCDDELELLKSRAYAGDPSALATLRASLSVLLRLFAPFLPYATEEVWSWCQGLPGFGQGSIHRATWPTIDELAAGGDPSVLVAAADVLSELRKAKTEAKRSMKTAITRAVVADTPERIAAIRAAEQDLREAGVVADLIFAEAAEFSVEVELEPPLA
jgi:valyl-tRNA synthetase